MEQQYAALLTRLDEQRAAYFEIEKQLRDLVFASASARKDKDDDGPASPGPGSPKLALPSPISPFEISGHKRTASIAVDTISKGTTGSVSSDSEGEEEEEFYVQTPLQPEEYDHEGLRRHLRETQWDENSRRILDGVVGNFAFLKKGTLFPTRAGAVDDRSHFSHHQVFDVGADGTPLAVELGESDRRPSNALLIWDTIRSLNPPDRERKAVGRITILRELSPVLYGAAHYTLHKHFDVDELFGHMVTPDHSQYSLTRAFHTDERRRRTFVFSFEYFTLIGDDCKPPSWQMADRQEDLNPDHIAIARASSVVALWLGGPPVKKLRNRSRRAALAASRGKGARVSTHGFVYDVFAPWRVVNLQSYPDWLANTEVHDSTRHYVNGVEAFLVSVLGELQDAQRRLEAIEKRIRALVTPPLAFIFDKDVREQLLFEDADFTYVKRYFWAGQTLSIVGESVKAMADAAEDAFPASVWDGTHKTLWPLVGVGEATSPRNVFYLRRMANLRERFKVEVQKLRELSREFDARRKEIIKLREELYVGTSIQESRKSVENSEITIQQGHNIKILTLVSMLFLPLTFVTSVFGMTDMPTEGDMWRFALVTVTVCVPFFLLIGSLNSNRGLRFWMNRWNVLMRTTGAFFMWAGRRLGRKVRENVESGDSDLQSRRSSDTQDVDWNKRRRRRTSTMFVSAASGSGSDRDNGEGGSKQDSHIRLPEKDSPAPLSPNSTWGVLHDKDIPALSSTQPSRLAGLMVTELKRKRTIRYSPGV